MPLEVIIAWWNLIYIVPFGIALIYLGLFVFTGITFGDADADVDTDAEISTDTHLHVEAQVIDNDVDADHDVEGDHDSDSSSAHVGTAIVAHSADIHSADVGTHPSLLSAFLSFLGIGKIPLSLALMITLLAWGFVGFALNALLLQWIGATAVIAVISVPLTLIITIALTGLCAALIGKMIPPDEASRQRHQDLVGKAGEAIYDIDADFGMARVRGTAGDFLQINCRTGDGKSRIPKGSRVVLFDYDRDKGVFRVAPFDA